MSLECTLEAAASADQVEFAFAIENTGDDPVELNFSDSQTHDVAVFDDGTEVWRWSEGRMFAQMLQSETLAPGEETTYEVAWEAPSPGDYEAVAELVARNADCEARTAFSV